MSVVIPVYNKERYIGRALQSISNQTYRNLETIIVDDGSTDGSVAAAAVHSDSRFRLIRQANAGPGAARNRGVEAAAGEVIAFLDADDYWEPEYLETSIRELTRSVADCLATPYITEPGGISSEPMWVSRGLTAGIQKVKPSMPAHRLAHMTAFMSMSSTVCRAEAIRRWGGFYTRNGCRYGEDAMLWLKILLNERVYFDFTPLAHVDNAAGELSVNFRGPRPVEPYLLDPNDLENACPAELRPLLRRFYARSACKTAAILGSWGKTSEAQQLMREYFRYGAEAPLLFAGAIASTRLGSTLGRLFRSRIKTGQRVRKGAWDFLA